MLGQTLYDKIWESHCVRSGINGFDLLYIDRHYVHEVTSPQAFEGLRLNQRTPWRANATIAVPDHNIPTNNREDGIADPISKIQVDALENNCNTFSIKELIKYLFFIK